MWRNLGARSGLGAEGEMMRTRSRALATAMVVSAAMITSACTSDAGAPPADSAATTTTEQLAPARVPTASGPVTGGDGAQAIGIDYDFASVGYQFDEYFFEGEAVGYAAVGELPTDGQWTVEETGTAP